MFKTTTAGSRRATVCLGHSEKGRPIEATVVGGQTAALRIVIVAGQHGDEPLSREAATALLADSDTMERWADRVQMAVVANVNPDGAVRNARRNARGIDLNRDHQLLRSAEVASLHRLVRVWRPHLVVDLHTYPPRREHLLELGLEYCHEVLVDWPSHPAVAGDGHREEDLLRRLRVRLASLGCLSDRYTLVRKSGRVRHSTPDVVDARNGLAVRYGVATLLVEGRQPTRGEGPAAARRIAGALHTALRGIVEWSLVHRRALLGRAAVPRTGEPIPIACRYRRSRTGRRMAFRMTSDAQVRHVDLPGPYTPSVATTGSVPMPAAYAVPKRAARLIALLRRHGFRGQTPRRAAGIFDGQQYHVCQLQPSRRPARAPRQLELRLHRTSARADEYIVFATHPMGGIALSLFLEPSSKYGLARWPESGLTLAQGMPFPILRVC